MAPSKPSRHWSLVFFTEPTVTEHEMLRYFIYGKEICPSSKDKEVPKIHWQAYIELYTPQRVSGIKKIFKDKTIHCEPRWGTRVEARDYCKKDGEWVEFGKWIKGQGHRSDLETIVQELEEGKKLSELMLEQPKLYCQYRNGLKDIASVVTKKNTKAFRKIDVILHTGPTGCGKTRVAMEEATYKIQGSQIQWWQDYEGEEIICIDEYSNNVKIDEMLALLDGYQLRLNVKGAHTYANWTKVHITTNLRIDQIHKEAKPAHRDAFFRRVTQVVDHWEKCNEEVHG